LISFELRISERDHLRFPFCCNGQAGLMPAVN
jgi:hypothetical protein